MAAFVGAAVLVGLIRTDPSFCPVTIVARRALGAGSLLIGSAAPVDLCRAVSHKAAKRTIEDPPRRFCSHTPQRLLPLTPTPKSPPEKPQNARLGANDPIELVEPSAADPVRRNFQRLR